ncbi:Bombesin Receptor Subtype-3 [Manis pentadactyla]|nr:Bombesin Receptor Subtype-3 [Manis pentadactyla]
MSKRTSPRAVDTGLANQAYEDSQKQNHSHTANVLSGRYLSDEEDTYMALHLPEESKHPSMVLKALHSLVLAFRCTFLDFDFLFYATLEDSFLEGCVGIPLILLYLLCPEMSFTNFCAYTSLTDPSKAYTNSTCHAKPSPTPPLSELLQLVCPQSTLLR